eukprot:TRINITY_DN22449_c0_g1_i2.p1 TRINITY_DN22449_c0_g1~~TRINITY_DN22449_c0_g1_i2.p1  ORF type:complete len:251 (+),score=38.29 TRINITY_DN22449_c0_g1_i2:74-826(+)
MASLSLLLRVAISCRLLQTAVEAARVAGHAHVASKEADSNSTYSGYPSCPGKGCIECTAKWLGYTLTEAGDTNHYLLTTQAGQQVPIVLPTQTFKGEGGSKNCFAYATHQKYQTPASSEWHIEKYGESPVYWPGKITWKSFQRAMKRERAIYLGRTTKELQEMKDLPVDEGTSYLIIAAFITPREEYHFWGLWNHGWYCVSSKISSLPQNMGYFKNPSKQCMTGSMWTQMRNKNPKVTVSYPMHLCPTGG